MNPTFHGASKIYSVNLHNIDHLALERDERNLSDETIRTMQKLKDQKVIGYVSANNKKIIISKQGFDMDGFNSSKLNFDRCLQELIMDLDDCET